MSQAPYSRAACAPVVDTENVVALWRPLRPRAAPAAIVSRLPEPSLTALHERTEGWAAGLRLAALSLAGHPDQDRLAAQFSGRDRTVAEYLLAEVLERQPAKARLLLLLRTSVPRMVLLDRNAQERPWPPLGPLDPLSKSEIRVLKYLPTHLSAPKIAGEMSLSTSTVRTPMRNLYGKLGAHSRAEAVQTGRVLGLLASPARQR